jgi:[NiFe] hydrogenase diaphorase moiety large subunit
MRDLHPPKPIRTQLLNKLWEIQDQKGFIPDQDVRELAQAFAISMAELDGVISFYHFFHRKPAGKYRVYLNHSIQAVHHGYDKVRAAFEEATGAAWGGIDPSGTFGLFDTSCIGLSDVEPAALINLYPFTRLTPEKVFKLVKQLKKGGSPEKLCDPVETQLRYVPENGNTILFKPYEAGKGLEKLKDFSPEDVIREMKHARLSGRGGAFFSTGAKWEMCRNAPGTSHYVVCNADEGEPGTFKDRALLTDLPGLLFEGMAIAGYSIGAIEGFIYLRAEYRYLKDKLEKTLAEFREKGLLGENIMGIEGFNFDIRIQLGAGAYVCGEETALLESMEGKRGEPRLRTFFPVTKGFLGQPTVVNNVETFCAVPRVLDMGLDRFLRTGTSQTPGTILFSISGDCKKPGIYEVEWGMTIKQLLLLCEADDPFMVQAGGPSGHVLSKREFDRKLCGEDLKSGGSFMVFNQSRSLIKILRNYAEFFSHESCGLCTPCRAGNFLLEQKLNKMDRGHGNRDDLDDVLKWGSIIRKTSRCGLGQSSSRSFSEAIEKFPEYFFERIQSNPYGVNNEFDLESALSEYNELNQNQK